MRALIVDDSAIDRLVVRETLRGMGIQSVETGSGEEALRALTSDDRVDVVLLDWNMPEMNGHQVLRAIRTNPALAAARILIVTSQVDMEIVKQALRAGADEYLMKPITRETISSKFALMGLE